MGFCAEKNANLGQLGQGGPSRDVFGGSRATYVGPEPRQVCLAGCLPSPWLPASTYLKCLSRDSLVPDQALKLAATQAEVEYLDKFEMARDVGDKFLGQPVDGTHGGPRPLASRQRAA